MRALEKVFNSGQNWGDGHWVAISRDSHKGHVVAELLMVTGEVRALSNSEIEPSY
jgi:hypothetical protein